MLILAKSILGLMLGFFVSVIAGLFIIPILRKTNVRQSVSVFTAFRHSTKDGTPTIGGLIFIIPTLLTMMFLYIRGSLELSHSLLIIILYLYLMHYLALLMII